MAAFSADGDGVRPYDAVLVARTFLSKYRKELSVASADPHAEVTVSHKDKFGPVGLRVFRPEIPTDNLCCLLDCAIDYVRLAEKNPKFDVGVKLISVAKLERDGEQIDPFRVLRSAIAIEKAAARVHILSQLNECWRRFACAKELAHVIMGLERGSVILDPQVQLELAFAIGDPGIDWSKDVSREVFAWLTAIELMLPYWQRQCLARQIENKVDRMLIAQHFRVPKPVIDMYVDTEYGRKSMEILAAVDASELTPLNPQPA